MLAYSHMDNQTQVYFVVIITLAMTYMWWYCSMAVLLLILELSEKQINKLLTNL